MSLLLLLHGSTGPIAYADTLSAGAYVVSGKTVSDGVGHSNALTQARIYTAWNPSDLGGSNTLSNGNLTDIISAGGIRASQSLSAGKWYWEVKITSIDAQYATVGIALSSWSKITSLGYTVANTVGWTDDNGGGNSTAVYNNTVQETFATTYVAGNVLGFAFDATNGTLGLYLNGVLQGTVTSLPAGAWFPAVYSGINLNVTANFGATAFAYAPPSGYNDGVFTNSSYAITGNALTDSIGHTDTLSKGTYSLAGQNITDVKVGGSTSYSDTLNAGAYALSGNTLSDSFSHADALSVGAYALSGKAITDSKAYSDALSKGTYALVGNTVSDVKTGSTSYLDNLLAGNYLYAGISIADNYVSSQPIQATPGFYKAYVKKQETEEEKRLRREAQGIIARAKTEKPSKSLYNDAQDVTEQIKLEIARLGLKAKYFEAQLQQQHQIEAQLKAEQLQSQINEIDEVFVMMMLIAQLD